MKWPLIFFEIGKTAFGILKTQRGGRMSGAVKRRLRGIANDAGEGPETERMPCHLSSKEEGEFFF